MLSDEIYGKLTFDRGDFRSFGQFLPERTIVLGGISKWGASGGWRLGFAALPELCRAWMPTVNSVISETISCVAAPIQLAATAAFEDSAEVSDFLLASNRSLELFGKYTARRFREMGAHVFDPLGAFYVFPDFSALLDDAARERSGVRHSEDFKELLFDRIGFSALSGMDFERPPAELTLRISFVNFDGDGVMKALLPKLAGKSQSQKRELLDKELDLEFVKAYGPNLVEGLDKFEELLNSMRK